MNWAAMRRVFLRRATRRGFSVITAYNDPKKLERYLLPSLRIQTERFELLTVDDSRGQFRCAADALNDAAARATGDLLMFVHQDVALGSPTCLEEARAAIRSLDRFGAAGVAGASPEGMVASVMHGMPPAPASSWVPDRPQRVETLDGCLMIVSRLQFLEQGFDPRACPGWHLYVADYCLDLRRRGLDAYVLPQTVYHESTGPSDPSLYDSTRQLLLEKHRDLIPRIHTTVGTWDTRQGCGENVS